MKHNLYFSAAICLLSMFFSTNFAHAQFNVLSQSRSLSLSVVDIYADNPSQNASDIASGSYNNTLSVDLDPPLDGSVSQTSIVSSSSLSGSGSANAYCNSGDFPSSLEVTTESTYTAEFTVASPTAFTYADQFAGTTYSINTGVEEISEYTTTLTSSEDTSPVFQFGSQIAPQAPASDSFSGILDPGPTYTLQSTASAEVSLTLPGNVGDTNPSFQFSLTSVPEPASAGALFCLGAILFRRRPRRGTF